MVKDYKKAKDKPCYAEVLDNVWLSRTPERPETYRFDKLFARSKVSIFGDVRTVENRKRRFQNLLTEMAAYFPQYEMFLHGDENNNTKAYKETWKHYMLLLDKWREKSPQKWRSSPRRSSTKSTAESVKQKSPCKKTPSVQKNTIRAKKNQNVKFIDDNEINDLES